VKGSLRRWRLRAGLLLPLAAVLPGVVGPTPAAASTLTATHTSSPHLPSCAAAVVIVAAVVGDLQPENRVKTISPDAGARVGDVATVSPDRVKENAAAFTTIVVGATLVNLSDPTGHRFTTGCEDSAAVGCFSSSAPPVMPCDVKGTCTQVDPGAGYYGSGFHQNPFVSVQSALQDCGQGLTCAEMYSLYQEQQLEDQGLQRWEEQLQQQLQQEEQQAQQASTCNNPVCGVGQGLFQTAEGVFSMILNPTGVPNSPGSQLLGLGEQLFGVQNNANLGGKCESWCWSGQAGLLVASLFGGEEADAARGLGLLERGSSDIGNIVYRGGSRTLDNLTPRLGDLERDPPGLSTWRNLADALKDNKKAQVIDLNQLPPELLQTIEESGHVTITTQDWESLIQWADLRSTEAENPLAQAIQNAIVGELRR
jgi:hypothetical protein